MKERRPTAGSSLPAPGNPDAALDRILDRASPPPENPWFVMRTLRAVRQTRRSLLDVLLAYFQPRRLAFATAAAAILAAAALLFPTSPSTPLETAKAGDLEIVADLDVLLADLQSDLWANDSSSL